MEETTQATPSSAAAPAPVPAPAPAPPAQAADLEAIIEGLIAGDEYTIRTASDVPKVTVALLRGPLRPVIEHALLRVINNSRLGPITRDSALAFVSGPLFDIIALLDGATREEVAAVTTSCCSWLRTTAAPPSAAGNPTQ